MTKSEIHVKQPRYEKIDVALKELCEKICEIKGGIPKKAIQYPSGNFYDV